ncbi:hypothetical protein OsI_05136 [Oryza sativa Indica Group]|uniref:Uncharacterized protein n=1 Tax=Oryza sativa subsp. indica TaxID=39946 RepID=B8A934_ORYSI|nr:hypothetical protein OsI_05136 [Oryza sativa Indica Group]
MLHRDDSSPRMWLRRDLPLLRGDSKLVIREGGGGDYLDLSLLLGAGAAPSYPASLLNAASPRLALDVDGSGREDAGDRANGGRELTGSFHSSTSLGEKRRKIV